MFKRLILTGPLVLALALVIPTHADTITYTATLLGSNEVPPTASPGIGFGIFTLNGNLLSIDETFSGLLSPASAAHIHCCGPVGVNEIVAVPFTPFPNAPSGHFTATVDLSLAATYNAAFITSIRRQPLREIRLYLYESLTPGLGCPHRYQRVI